MAFSEPERAPSGRPRTALYTSAGRRRRSLLGAAVALVVLGAAGQVLVEGPRPAPGARPGSRTRLDPTGRSARLAWPQRGQAAFVLGSSTPAASPHQEPAPIASLAKVMTAYLTLERYPLSDEQQGFAITVTPEQAQAEAREAAQGQSVVPVRAGEQLTERQLLEALLIPSGNNIARTLATLVAGSEDDFLAEMNTEARALGMRNTTYTDPSGFDPGTLSTAEDQLRVLRRAMRFPVFRQIVSTAAVTLPVAGTLANFNPLIAAGYAGKTGSDSEAGGCLAFFTEVTSGGRRLTAAGVVMGQGEGGDTKAILAAAGEAAQRLVGSASERAEGALPNSPPDAPRGL